MRSYNATEWASIKNGYTIALTSKDTYEIDIVSAGPITINGHTTDGEVIPIASSPNHIHLKHKFEGFTALEISLTKAGGLRVKGRPMQPGEPMDDRLPPPPKEPTNILQQMRSVIRQELSDKRESFLSNDTGLPTFEIDDDSDDFEEEIVAARKAQLDKINKSPPDDAPTSTEAPTDDPKPQPAPEAAPTS